MGHVERFLFHEAELLDQRRFEEWLDLYTDDCVYWIPLEEGQSSPDDTVSIVYDDRMLLETRVRRFAHPRFHAQTPPSRTCHLISNVRVTARSDEAIVVRSALSVVEYRLGHQRLYAGACEHHLSENGADFRIARKRIDLIDSEGDQRGLSIIL